MLCVSTILLMPLQSLFRVQSLLMSAARFKEQEKRLAFMEAEVKSITSKCPMKKDATMLQINLTNTIIIDFQVKYCGEVLSWMAECFKKSTLKCDRDVPKSPRRSSP